MSERCVDNAPVKELRCRYCKQPRSVHPLPHPFPHAFVQEGEGRVSDIGIGASLGAMVGAFLALALVCLVPPRANAPFWFPFSMGAFVAWLLWLCVSEARRKDREHAKP